MIDTRTSGHQKHNRTALAFFLYKFIFTSTNKLECENFQKSRMYELIECPNYKFYGILINMKVLTFVKDENMRFLKPLLTWVMIKNVHLAAGLLHYSTSRASTALLMATAHLYNIDRRLSIRLCNVLSSYTTQKQIHNSTMPTFCPANRLPLFIILLQLPPISSHCRHKCSCTSK